MAQYYATHLYCAECTNIALYQSPLLQLNVPGLKHYTVSQKKTASVVQAHTLGEVGHFRQSFVKGLFRDKPSNFY